MKMSARRWWVLGGVVVALAAAVWIADPGPRRAVHEVRGAARRDDGGVTARAEPRAPQSDVRVQEPTVPPVPTAVPGTVAVERGAGRDLGKTIVRWELGFPRGVWSLRFVLGSPDVELRFLDLSRVVSEDCHALSAITERGSAPFPDATFDAATRTARLDDMPLEVVEALTRARELTLVACDARFPLDDAQQRVLIDFYVQATGVILDALSADAGSASTTRETR